MLKFQLFYTQLSIPFFPGWNEIPSKSTVQSYAILLARLICFFFCFILLQLPETQNSLHSPRQRPGLCSDHAWAWSKRNHDVLKEFCYRSLCSLVYAACQDLLHCPQAVGNGLQVPSGIKSTRVSLSCFREGLSFAKAELNGNFKWWFKKIIKPVASRQVVRQYRCMQSRLLQQLKLFPCGALS